ncbi:MAG: hypothetical protein NTW87_36350 [Planctomycetota bacterium]|nr:hypothetical protein [Planctomycetota bacterium]
MSSSTATHIRATCCEIGEFLIAKSRSCGDSALNPVRIFARGDAVELLRVRIDDKLSRIRNAPDAYGEDAVMDLLGYLVLLRIATEHRTRGTAAKSRSARRHIRRARFGARVTSGRVRYGSSRSCKSLPGIGEDSPPSLEFLSCPLHTPVARPEARREAPKARR